MAAAAAADAGGGGAERDWKETLYFWRGRLGPPAGAGAEAAPCKLEWRGAWVASEPPAAHVEPGAAAFAASPNAFALRCRLPAQFKDACAHLSPGVASAPLGSAAGAGAGAGAGTGAVFHAAAMASPATGGESSAARQLHSVARAPDAVAVLRALHGASGDWKGHYLMDNDGSGRASKYKDVQHSFRLETTAFSDGGSPASAADVAPSGGVACQCVCAARGETEFGSFVSLGAIRVRGGNAGSSGAAAAGASYLELTLARRYVDDEDPRASWTLRQVLDQLPATAPQRVRDRPWETCLPYAYSHGEDTRASASMSGAGADASLGMIVDDSDGGDATMSMGTPWFAGASSAAAAAAAAAVVPREVSAVVAGMLDGVVAAGLAASGSTHGSGSPVGFPLPLSPLDFGGAAVAGGYVFDAAALGAAAGAEMGTRGTAEAVKRPRSPDAAARAGDGTRPPNLRG